jgi:hypothetical protein
MTVLWSLASCGPARLVLHAVLRDATGNARGGKVKIGKTKPIFSYFSTVGNF